MFLIALILLALFTFGYKNKLGIQKARAYLLAFCPVYPKRLNAFKIFILLMLFVFALTLLNYIIALRMDSISPKAFIIDEKEVFDSIAFVVRTNSEESDKTSAQLETFLGDVKYKLAFDSKDAKLTGIASVKDKSAYPGHTLINAFMALFNKYPKAEWFMAINPETYVLTHNLAFFLSAYNSSEPYFFGAPMRFKGCGISSFVNAPTMAMEAGGTILSRGSLIKLSEGLDHCLKTYTTCWTMDTALSVCLGDLKIEIDQDHGYPFNTKPLDDNFIYPPDPCTLPLTFGGMAPSQMSELIRVEQSHRLKDEITRTTASILMPEFLGLDVDETLYIDKDFQGMDYNKIFTLQVRNCKEFCSKDPQCVAYSYRDMTCYKKSGVAGMIDRKGVTSGIVKKNYVCHEDIIF